MSGESLDLPCISSPVFNCCCAINSLDWYPLCLLYGKIQADGKTVFTSDEALDLAFVPEYVAIVGSGYIGLEFSDVYTALGAEVTFIEVRHHTR